MPTFDELIAKAIEMEIPTRVEPDKTPVPIDPLPPDPSGTQIVNEKLTPESLLTAISWLKQQDMQPERYTAIVHPSQVRELMGFDNLVPPDPNQHRSQPGQIGSFYGIPIVEDPNLPVDTYEIRPTAPAAYQASWSGARQRELGRQAEATLDKHAKNIVTGAGTPTGSRSTTPSGLPKHGTRKPPS